MTYRMDDQAAKDLRHEASGLSTDQLHERLVKERALLHDVFAQAGDPMDPSKVTAVQLDDGDALEQYVRASHAEQAILSAVHAAKTETDNIRTISEDAHRRFNTPATRVPHVETAKSMAAIQTMGDRFLASKGYTERGPRGGDAVNFDDVDAAALMGMKDPRRDAILKTVMSTGAGFAPESVRTGDVVPIAAAGQPTTTLDLLPSRPVSPAAVVFMRQTTRTNAAAEIAESTNGSLQSAPEGVEAFTEITEPIRKINYFIPITDEQLEDEAQLAAIIDTDMILGVRQRLNLQVLVGNGTAPNIEGFFDAGRSNGTQAKGTDNVPDAIYKAMTTSRFTARVEPDAVIIHPNDWQDIRLLTTTDGVYVFGPPSQAGVDTIWGKPVVVDSDITENTALVGAFQSHCYVAVRRGVAVQISSEHASYFIQGVKAVLAEMRAGLVVRREDAFTTVTGI